MNAPTIDASYRPGTRQWWTAVLAAASPLCLWLGILGPDWLYVPPGPARPVAANLNFAALSALTAHSHSTVQHAYFGWLAWTFAGLSTVLAVLAVRTSRASALLLIGGAGELVVTVLATKGDLTWHALADQTGNTRLGQALALVSPCLLMALGALRTADSANMPMPLRMPRRVRR